MESARSAAREERLWKARKATIGLFIVSLIAIVLGLLFLIFSYGSELGITYIGIVFVISGGVINLGSLICIGYLVHISPFSFRHQVSVE